MGGRERQIGFGLFAPSCLEPIRLQTVNRRLTAQFLFIGNMHWTSYEYAQLSHIF